MNSVHLPSKPGQSRFVTGLKNLSHKINLRETWHLVTFSPDGTGKEYRSLFSGTFRDISNALESAGYDMTAVDADEMTSYVTFDGEDTEYAVIMDWAGMNDCVEMDADLMLDNMQEAISRIDAMTGRMDTIEMMEIK